MKKLLVICGPTATGKTSLAFKLAKEFNGELISADSRQLYKYMDIGTGKEWGELPIHGYDLIDPWEEYSVSAFVKFARKTIKKIIQRGKLPILIGGTGLYIKGVIDGFETVEIPKNDDLRNTLKNKNVNELFEQLATLDSSRAASLNLSDKKNPTRLIRAIEVAIWKIDNGDRHVAMNKIRSPYDPLFIGLTAPTETITKKIAARVEERMNQGFILEVESLLRMGVSWKNQSMKSLGYREVEKFLKQGQTYEEFINDWARGEVKYFKRQLTWFKKDPRINWFDITDGNYAENVENLVKKWLNTSVKDKDGQKN